MPPFSTPRLASSLDARDHAVVYALAAHRDEGTAAATLVYRATESPESVRAYLVHLAGTFETAGCPSMAGHARRIAREIEAEAPSAERPAAA